MHSLKRSSLIVNRFPFLALISSPVPSRTLLIRSSFSLRHSLLHTLVRSEGMSTRLVYCACSWGSRLIAHFVVLMPWKIRLNFSTLRHPSSRSVLAPSPFPFALPLEQLSLLLVHVPSHTPHKQYLTSQPCDSWTPKEHSPTSQRVVSECNENGPNPRTPLAQ